MRYEPIGEPEIARRERAQAREAARPKKNICILYKYLVNIYYFCVVDLPLYIISPFFK
jgi:hypothetical protein